VPPDVEKKIFPDDASPDGQQPGFIPARKRMLGDPFRGKNVIVIPDVDRFRKFRHRAGACRMIYLFSDEKKLGL
jgi:hypothetical protein